MNNKLGRAQERVFAFFSATEVSFVVPDGSHVLFKTLYGIC